MPTELDMTFSALAHPVRRAMLAKLSEGPVSVNALAEPFDMSLPAISKHIKVLEKAGLISRGRDAQFRPCSLNPEPLEQISNWADQYRPIWEARFDKLQSALNTMKEPSHDE